MQHQENDEGSDPVPSPRTHLQARGGQDVDGAPSSLLSETDPIQLTDIDRVLEDSASLAESNQAAPVRIWREELTVALESLSYARSVLASDVGILRHCLENESTDPKALVDELPRLVAGRTGGLSSSPRTDDPRARRQDASPTLRLDRLHPLGPAHDGPPGDGPGRPVLGRGRRPGAR